MNTDQPGKGVLVISSDSDADVYVEAFCRALGYTALDEKETFPGYRRLQQLPDQFSDYLEFHVLYGHDTLADYKFWLIKKDDRSAWKPEFSLPIVQIVVLLYDPFYAGYVPLFEKTSLINQEIQHRVVNAVVEYIRYHGYQMPITLLYLYVGDRILSDEEIAGAKALPEVQIVRCSIHATQSLAFELSKLWNK